MEQRLIDANALCKRCLELDAKCTGYDCEVPTMPTIEAESVKWIPVTERLPQYGERVLITEGNAVFEASLSISHKWVRCGIGWTEGVTHWMHLPTPPKGE